VLPPLEPHLPQPLQAPGRLLAQLLVPVMELLPHKLKDSNLVKQIHHMATACTNNRFKALRLLPTDYTALVPYLRLRSQIYGSVE
jgi:hypothetical protein